jgi:hypothetical protein
VAIVGNDVVLAASPATPVQLAHACLRRGFSVAVPASWGDELVAAETVRQLRSRDRGPAVMCVCPYVRSRLLGPGPDLAPFLVSLVPPPVATARYLRALYGDHGVHITYIGGCPSGEDATIDERLTPDRFLADLAERGIALGEMPLVFDSIVPPDRRRWCSLPGGVPSAEGLWSETDARTLVEIDRDDASTELVQHIITREHVLLDLAPGFGCACSGAVGSVAARNARLAVTALEPPRALGPIIDPSMVVPVDFPVGTSALGAERTPAAPPVEVAPVADPALEIALDAILGGDPADFVDDPVLQSDEATVMTIDEPFVLEAVAEEPVVVETVVAEAEAALIEQIDGEHDARSHPSPTTEPVPGNVDPPAATVAVMNVSGSRAKAPNGRPAGDAQSAVNADAAADAESSVRRRTPSGAHARYSSATIPKSTGADGRPLPRAYVAKRRTPPAGAIAIPAISLPTTPEPPVDVIAEPTPDARPSDAAPGNVTAPGAAGHPEEAVDTAAVIAQPAAAVQPVPRDNPGTSPTTATAVIAPPAPSVAAVRPTLEPPTPTEPDARVGSVAAPPANQGALVFLLVTALVALAAFVLFSLRR